MRRVEEDDRNFLSRGEFDVETTLYTMGRLAFLAWKYDANVCLVHARVS